MRNMSFFHTQEQIRNGTKTVTRRLGWGFLKPGDLVCAVEKGQGLKKGEKVQRIKVIRIEDTRPEPLMSIDQADVIREGFPELMPFEFVMMFCEMNKCRPMQRINRIVFSYHSDAI